MGFVDSKKLEMVANFIAELEVDGNCLCTYFNSSLNRNRVKVPCDTGCCGGVCPFYSKENFIKWIKKPDSKYDVEALKKPKEEDFIGYDPRKDTFALSDEYITALEKYCNDLESALADTEYDLETAECVNRELLNRLKQIRGVLDGAY